VRCAQELMASQLNLPNRKKKQKKGKEIKQKNDLLTITRVTRKQMCDDDFSSVRHTHFYRVSLPRGHDVIIGYSRDDSLQMTAN